MFGKNVLPGRNSFNCLKLFEMFWQKLHVIACNHNSFRDLFINSKFVFFAYRIKGLENHILKLQKELKQLETEKKDLESKCKL